MPDPTECHRRALECVWMAQAPSSSQERDEYLNLAKLWLILAKGLRKSESLAEQSDIHYHKAS
jgi:hypothetical protein